MAYDLEDQDPADGLNNDEVLARRKSRTKKVVFDPKAMVQFRRQSQQALQDTLAQFANSPQEQPQQPQQPPSLARRAFDAVDTAISNAYGDNSAPSDVIDQQGLEAQKLKDQQDAADIATRRKQLREQGIVGTGMLGRVQGDLSAGVGSTIGSTLQTIGRWFDWQSAQNFGDYLTKQAAALMPEDPTYLDNLLNGAGSMFTMVIPGLGVSGTLMRAGLLGLKGAGTVSSAIGALIEAPGVAQETYDNVMRNTGNAKLAGERAFYTFLGELPLIFVTDKLGVFGDGKSLFKKLAWSGLMEGPGQEGVQQLHSNWLGYEPLGKGFSESSAIGAMLGSGTGGAMSAIEHYIENSKQYAEDKPGVRDGIIDLLQRSDWDGLVTGARVNPNFTALAGWQLNQLNDEDAEAVLKKLSESGRTEEANLIRAASNSEQMVDIGKELADLHPALAPKLQDAVYSWLSGESQQPQQEQLAPEGTTGTDQSAVSPVESTGSATTAPDAMVDAALTKNIGASEGTAVPAVETVPSAVGVQPAATEGASEGIPSGGEEKPLIGSNRETTPSSTVGGIAPTVGANTAVDTTVHPAIRHVMEGFKAMSGEDVDPSSITVADKPNAAQTQFGKWVKAAFGAEPVYVNVAKDGVRSVRGTKLQEGGFEGVSIEGTRYVLVNNSLTDGDFLETLGHELTHQMEEQAPEVFQVLKEAAFRHASRQGKAELRSNLMKSIAMEQPGLSPEQLDAEVERQVQKEVPAYVSGQQWRDPAYWEEAFKNQNAGFVTKVINAVKALLNKAQAAAMKVGLVRGQKDIAAIRTAVARAFKQWEQLERAKRPGAGIPTKDLIEAKTGVSKQPAPLPKGIDKKEAEKQREERKPENIVKKRIVPGAKLPVKDIVEAKTGIKTEKKPFLPKGVGPKEAKQQRAEHAKELAEKNQAEAAAKAYGMVPDIKEDNAAIAQGEAAKKAYGLDFARKSDVGHKREEKTGRYVGAPDWVKTPAHIAVLRRKLRQLALDGESGRYWYERSSRAVLDFTGNKADAEKFVGLLAIYSQGTEVSINVGFALEAYFQWKAGLPIRSGRFPTEQTKKAEAWLYRGEDWGGIKTNNFYADLMSEIDPSKVDEGHATMDMWMAIAFDYGYKVLDQGPKYNFAKRETARLAEELGWEPHQVQAAIWTAIKVRTESTARLRKDYELTHGIGEMFANKKGKPAYRIKPGREYDHFRTAHRLAMRLAITKEQIAERGADFADELRNRTVQLSWEAKPGETVGVLPRIFEAPIEQQGEYFKSILGRLYRKGRDLIAEKVGLPDGVQLTGFSAWKGEVGVGGQMFLPIHMLGNGIKRAAGENSARMLNLYSALKGYILSQEAVVWHVPLYEVTKKQANGHELIYNRALTREEMQQLYRTIHDHFGTWELAPGYTGEGARVLNFVKGLDNQQFQDGMDRVAQSLPEDFGGGLKERGYYRSTGAYISNDWEQFPNGQQYLEEIAASATSAEESSALLRWADDVRAGVEAINRHYSDKYGWGEWRQPQTRNILNFSRSTEPAVRPSDRSGRPGSVEVTGIHYSHGERQELNASLWGSGIRGREAGRLARADDPRIKRRVYFYIQDGDQLPTREGGLGPWAHVAQLSNLYESGVSEPLVYTRTPDQDATNNRFESAVLDAGYDGYVHRAQRMAVVLNKNVPVKLQKKLDFKRDEKTNDNVQQAQWLEQQSKQLGFQNLDDLLAKDPAKFAALATTWRAVNPLNFKRVTESPQFKAWFGKSVVVDYPELTGDSTGWWVTYWEGYTRRHHHFAVESEAEAFYKSLAPRPKIMFHGTGRNIRVFRPKQANAIFVTESPSFADDFATMSEEYIRNEIKDLTDMKALREWARQEAADQIRYEMREAKEDDGTRIYSDDDIESFVKKALDGGSGPTRIEYNDHYLRLMREAIEEKMPSMRNIMPVFVKAENPFDYENINHLGKLLEHLKNTHPTNMDGDFIDPIVIDGLDYPVPENLVARIGSGDWSKIESKVIQKAIKELGHDGFYMQEAGEKNLAVYEPTQIKSAIGNNGNFDPRDPRIHFKRAPEQKGERFTMSGETVRQLVQRKMQDRENRVLQAQKDVIAQGGSVPPAADTYGAMERFTARTAAIIEDFNEKVVHPFVDKLAKSGWDFDDVSLYMMARGAEDRNKKIAKINPKFPDGGSGMMTAKAKQLLAQYQADPKYAKLVELERDLRKIIEKTQQTLVASGEVTPATMNGWKAEEPLYVPYKGFEKIDEWGQRTGNVGQGFDIRGPAERRAYGRKSQAGQVIENIILGYERAVIRAEKNRVIKTLANFVMQNPDDGLWQVQMYEQKPYFQKNGQLNMYGLLDGEVKYRSELNMDRDQTFVAKHDGKDVVVWIKDRTMAEALHGKSVDIPEFLHGLSTFNRFLAKAWTSLNPVFVSTNFIRDYLTGMIHAGNVGGAKYMGAITRDLFWAMRGIREVERNGTANSPAAQMYQQYKGDGGAVGFYMFKDVESKQEELRKLLAQAKDNSVPGAAMKGLRAIHDFIMDYNSMVENAIRLAAYKNAIEMGKTRAEASSIAKNLTVNFNRRGEWTPLMSGLYLFFNPSVQGVARIMSAAKNNPVEFSTLTAGLVVMGLAMGLMNAEDKDEKGVPYWDNGQVPQWERSRNLVFMVGGGNRINIPLAYGYGWFVNLGYALADVSRGHSTMKAAGDLMSTFMDHFSPINGVGDNPMTAISPTILDPAAEWAMNKKSIGTPLMPDEEKISGQPIPASERYWGKTRGTAVQQATEWLNEATGGSKSIPGYISISPEVINNFLSYYGGGGARFWKDVLDGTMTMAGIDTKTAVEKGQLPFVRQFYKAENVSGDMRFYMDAKKEALAQLDEFKLYMNQPEVSPWVRERLQTRREIALLGQATRNLDKALRTLRLQEVKIMENDKLSAADREMERDKLDAIKQKLLREWNSRFYGAEMKQE